MFDEEEARRKGGVCDCMILLWLCFPAFDLWRSWNRWNFDKIWYLYLWKDNKEKVLTMPDEEDFRDVNL